MIEQAIVWIGEHVVAASAFGIALIAIALIIYVAHDLPPPVEDDDDQSGWGV